MVGDGELGVTELNSDFSFCIVYILPKHRTLYASKVILTFFKYTFKDRPKLLLRVGLESLDV